MFHETDGYQWSKRASDLIGRSNGKNKEGDAAAVLRELGAEPSGLIGDVLHRLGTTPDAVLEQLQQTDQLNLLGSSSAAVAPAAAKVKGRVSGSTETFVPASIEEVWEFLADPARVPEREMSVGSIELTTRDATSGMVWQGHVPTRSRDGKPVKMNPEFHRRSIELVEALRPDRIAWRFAYPDTSRSRPR